MYGVMYGYSMLIHDLDLYARSQWVSTRTNPVLNYRDIYASTNIVIIIKLATSTMVGHFLCDVDFENVYNDLILLL